MQIIGREEFEKDVYGITILPSQEFSYSFIYSGTIEDNICFGVDEQDRNKDRIKEATRIAYANEFIDLLPEGYQTIVGEKGVKLSGGQRQRLAIARAIYWTPLCLFSMKQQALWMRIQKERFRMQLTLPTWEKNHYRSSSQASHISQR